MRPCLQLPICFLPNNRASIDNAPGPIIASVAPSVANMSAIHPSPGDTTAIHTSTTAISAPVTGVHKPNIIGIASTAPKACGAMVTTADISLNDTIQSWSKAIPVTNRWTRSPNPGHPLANVEKSLCNDASSWNLLVEATAIRATRKPLIVGVHDPTFGGSQSNDAAL
jgi:hypothetical protein